jgi:FkbM family methyltransferase
MTERTAQQDGKVGRMVARSGLRSASKTVLRVLSRMLPRAVKDYLRANLQPRDEVFWVALGRFDPSIKTIFDVGANVGDVTLHMLEVFPAATIYAFEPCASTFGVLSQRVAESPHWSRVKLFNLGLYDESSSLTLNITSHHGANSLVGITPEYHVANPHIQETAGEEIELVRLDDFIRAQGVTHIDLMKIDVEGAEYQVISGGSDSMKSMVDAVMCEISFVRHPRSHGEFIRLFELMHELGFAPAEFYDIAQGDTGTVWRLGQLDCVFRRFSA